MSTDDDATISGDASDRAPVAACLPERGEVVGRYMVLDPIGRGAMGAVFAAYDPELDRKVALKLLLDDDPRARQRMQREARALASAIPT